MTEIAEHYNPIGKAATLEVWRKRMRMPVSTAEGYISDPVKQFGVTFSENPPDWPKYGIPVLWRKGGNQGRKMG
jgi:hypothetical protein